MTRWKLFALVIMVTLVGAPLLRASTDCYSTITGTKGPNAISYCITANGNVLQMKGEGLSQEGNFEGYEVQVVDPFGGSNSRYYDYGVSSFGFNAPVIFQPNGPNTFPLKITRTSIADVSITLEQTFRKDTSDPSILLIDMKVTIFRDWPRVHIDIVRAADITADQDPANTVQSVGSRSILSSKPGGHGVLLSTLSTVDDFTETWLEDCSIAAHVPSASGTATCATYRMLLPHRVVDPATMCCAAYGASRKVTFEYKLF